MAATAAPLEARLDGVERTVAGQTVVIPRRLSLDQWIGIAQVARRVSADISVEDAQAALKKSQEDGKGDVAFLVSLLSKPVILGLYSVITGVDEPTLDATFSMPEFLGVISAIKESGELPEIVAAFKTVAGGW